MRPHVASESLGHLLAQVCKRLRDRVHARMGEIGLHRGQGLILHRLGYENGLAQTELARQTLVRPATLTGALQRMESAGLIERRTDPSDQRVSRVYLTARGEAARVQAAAIWEEVEDEIHAALSAEERAQLAPLLRKLGDALAREESP